MSDSKDEPTPLAEEPTPDFRLAERLLARATHSLGVIDVRRAERHYARVMDWLAARTPLVEHLRSRYGLAEDEGATGLGLAFADATGQARAHVSDEGINLSTAPDSFTASAAEQLFTAVAHVPDDSAAAETETRRITRRGLPTFSPASYETANPTPERAGPNQEKTRGSHAPPPVKEIPAAPAETTGARTPDAAQTSRSRAAPSPPSEESIPPTRRTILSVEERRAVSTAEQAKTLARAEEPLVSAGELIPTRSAEARGSTDQSASSRAANHDASRADESSGANTRPSEAPARAPFGVRERKSATGADVLSEEGEMALRRRGAAEGAKSPASGAAGVKVFVASETRAASVSEETPRPLARAREIPASASRRESATLRVQSPLPLAASPVGVESEEVTRRQNGSATSAARGPPPSTSPTSPPAASTATTSAASSPGTGRLRGCWSPRRAAQWRT